MEKQNMKGFFITGTDTNVGKTVITAGLLYLFRKNEINAISMKPIQTGAKKSKGKLYSQDLAFSLKTCGLSLSHQEIRTLSPFCYKVACSPHLAGKIEGKYPSSNTIIGNLNELKENYGCILIEGAGGVMVPLNKTETMLDLMKKVNFPIILVARNILGTINHTLLSINMLKASGLRIAGIIFNDAAPGSKKYDLIKKDNISIISKIGQVEILGIIKYLPQIQKNKKRFVHDFNTQLYGKKLLLNMIKTGTKYLH